MATLLTVNFTDFGANRVVALDGNANDIAGSFLLKVDPVNDGIQGGTITLNFNTAYTRLPYAWVNCATFLGTAIPISYVVFMDKIVITILEKAWHGGQYNFYYYVLDSSAPAV